MVAAKSGGTGRERKKSKDKSKVDDWAPRDDVNPGTIVPGSLIWFAYFGEEPFPKDDVRWGIVVNVSSKPFGARGGHILTWEVIGTECGKEIVLPRAAGRSSAALGPALSGCDAWDVVSYPDGEVMHAGTGTLAHISKEKTKNKKNK